MNEGCLLFYSCLVQEVSRRQVIQGINYYIETIYQLMIDMVSRAEAGLMTVFGLLEIALAINEYADEEQLTMTVVLDLAGDSSLGQGKFSTFETAIRLAASFGYYATHKNIPFYLIGANRQGELPRTALSWWGILNLLAKVKNDGQRPLVDVLSSVPVSPFVVVLASHPTAAIVKAVAEGKAEAEE